MILRSAPLLVLIALIWIILSVLSLVGRGKAYETYVSEDKFAPGVSIFMRGLHDHVLPWSDSESAGKKTGKASEDSVDTEKTRSAAEDEDEDQSAKMPVRRTPTQKKT